MLLCNNLSPFYCYFIICKSFILILNRLCGLIDGDINDLNK